MRLSKYLTALVLLTCCSLLYAHQQFLLIKANYIIKSDEVMLSQLLDRYKTLMYNVATLESPASLEIRLKNNGMKYAIPSEWAVAPERETPVMGVATVSERRSVVLERFFSFIDRKTEARSLANKPASM